MVLPVGHHPNDVSLSVDADVNRGQPPVQRGLEHDEYQRCMRLLPGLPAKYENQVD
jgi:hypothetical protein